MDLLTMLRGLAALGPVKAALPSVQTIIAAATKTMSEPDQAVAQEAYADLMAENDEGHARLQAKLAAAAAGG